MNKGKILTPLVLDESDKKDIIYYPINENDTPGEEKSNGDINKKNNKNENSNFALYLGTFSLSIIGLILIIKICLMINYIKFGILFISINSAWMLLWFLNFFFFVSSINEKRHCVVLSVFFFIGLFPSICDFFISRRYLRIPGKAYIMAYELLSTVNIILYSIIIVLYCYHTSKIKSKK